MEARNISVNRESGEPSLEDVKHFWEGTPCGELFIDNESVTEGSDRYFELITSERYRYEYHLRPFIEDFAAATNRGSVLEIGCGMGIDLSQIAQHGCATTGVDLTERGIELARKNFARLELPGEFKVDNAEDLPFEDATFDGVYSFGVLHHTPSTSQAIEEVRRVLRPGGWAYIMLYSRFSLNRLVHLALRAPYEKNVHEKFADAPVTRAYSKSELKHLFSTFSDRSFSKQYLFGAGYKPIVDFVPTAVNRLAGRALGWHWLIKAQK